MNSSLPNRYSGRDIARKTAWGFIWNFSAYFLGKIIVLITTAILARLLAKSDFGLVAVAVVAIAQTAGLAAGAENDFLDFVAALDEVAAGRGGPARPGVADRAGERWSGSLFEHRKPLPLSPGPFRGLRNGFNCPREILGPAPQELEVGSAAANGRVPDVPDELVDLAQNVRLFDAREVRHDDRDRGPLDRPDPRPPHRW